MPDKLAELREKLGEVEDLKSARAMLTWDQETYMPPLAAEARAKQLGTISKLAHSLFTSEEIGELLAELEGWAESQDSENIAAAIVLVAKREYDKAKKLPNKLVAELAEATGLAVNAWTKAKQQSDFPGFLPYLERLIDLNVQKAEALGYTTTPYDALLDEFEPGMTTALVEQLFSQLKEPLVALVKEIRERGAKVQGDFLYGNYPLDAQERFGLEVLRTIGFDLNAGRLDQSEHPFTMGVSLNDVRITTRYASDNLVPGLFAIIHEGGHGMYYQGIDKRFNRTLVAEGASSAIHESQSRLWENVVGSSREFWLYFYPRLQEIFPGQLTHTDCESFYRAINRVEPSLIRVEADEVTYNLHIFLRFDLERELIAGKLQAADLPESWNGLMEAYLGMVPPDDAQGVLQDIHWASSLFGYFPTYALGNIYSAQFYEKALEVHPDIPKRIAAGDFSQLFGWMKENVWSLGNRLKPLDVLKRATGDGANVQPYLRYIERKYRDIYGL